jgi:hypothetical protein
MFLILLLAQCIVSIPTSIGLPISSLERQDDAIIVGTGVQGRAGLNVTVHRVIQGPLEVAQVVPVEWHTGLPRTCQELSGRVHGLWFLRKGPSGWVANPFQSPPLTFRDVAVALPEADVVPEKRDVQLEPPIDKIVDELIGATESDEVRLGQGAYAAIGTIMSIGRRLAALPYHPRNLPPDHAATCALRQLIRNWDLIVVKRIEHELVLNPSEQNPRALLALWDVRDPRALPALGRIWDSGRGGPLVRNATVEAVRTIHTEKAIPLLVRFMDEPDWETRYAGVTGLAMFAKHCSPGDSQHCPQPHGDPAILAANQHYPAVKVFQNDPDPYIAFWRDWVAHQTPRAVGEIPR